MNAPAPSALAVRAADLRDPGECARLDAFVAEHPDGGSLPSPAMEPDGRARLRPARALSGRRAWRRPGRLPAADRGPLAPVRQRLRGFAASPPAAASSPTTKRPPRRWPRRAGRSPAGTAATARASRRPACRRAGRRQQGTYSSFDRDLPGDDEALLASLPRRQRAEVRKRARKFELDDVGRRRPIPSRRALSRLSESVRNLGTPIFPRASVRGGARRIRRRRRHRPRPQGRPSARRHAQSLFQGNVPALLGRRHPRGAATGAPTTSSITS